MALAFSWSRFETPSLDIAAALAGDHHEFVFAGHTTRVRLPPASAAGDGAMDRLFITQSLSADGTPVTYAVRDVDVELDQLDTDLVRGLVARDKPDPNVDAVAEMGEVAGRAFDYWIRVVRWQAKSHRIGRLTRQQRDTWGSRLRETGTRRQLASHAIRIVVSLSSPLSPELWTDIAGLLVAGSEPPVSFDLYFDSLDHIDHGDLRRAIVDLANAAELFLRSRLDRSLPSALTPAVRKYAMRANASVLLSRFAPEILGAGGPSFLQAKKADLAQLFELRNRLVHSSDQLALTESMCRQLGRVTKELLELDEGAK